MKGYNQKIAHIDLTTGKIEIETPDETFYRKYFGGRGFIVHTLLKETPAHVDPLGPENRLIFALGPITGHLFAGSGRHSVGSKSPLTGGYGESETGGFFGAALKHAGFDALILHGTAAEPVYLYIEDGQIKILDGAHLWGVEVAAAHQKIRDQHGGRKVRTAVIGPAGENKVNYACIMHDVSFAAGRTGLGAVMGSKNLKAIAVKGSQRPGVCESTKLAELNKMMAKDFKNRTKLWQCGTGQTIVKYEETGKMPIRNFTGGRFPNVWKIAPKIINENYLVKMKGCFGCPIRCKRVVKLEEPYKVDPIYGCPEYEALAGFGSNCGVDDLPVIMKANELCNRYGMDVLSAGGSIAFAMECFEEGLLTIKDTNGLDLKFGNGSAMLALIEHIAFKRGLGATLAEGSRKAAKIIGKGAIRFSMQVKGKEIPMHEPRFNQLLGVHYSVHATGADHNTGIYNSDVLEESLANTLKQKGLLNQLANSLVVCRFVPWTIDEICNALAYITGWQVNEEELREVVDRSVTLTQVFNLREGISADDYKLPKRFFQTPVEGALKGLDPVVFASVQKAYYNLLGWDDAGVPTQHTLEELDIEWARP